MRENNLVTEEIQKNSGFSRRTIVKGAAWSVPVIAAAVATPLAAASTALDLTIAGNCAGEFRAAGLASNILNALTGLLGLDPATRTITVTAGTVPVPVGTTFLLDNSGLLNVGLIGVTGALDVSALDIVNVGGGVTSITLQQQLLPGQSFTLDLLPAVVDVKVAATQTLSLSTDAANNGSVGVLAGSTVNVLGLVNVDLQLCA